MNPWRSIGLFPANSPEYLTDIMSDKEKIETIQEVADAVGGRVEDTYSGRSMYGQTCYGIFCDDPDYCIEEAASRGIRGAKEDNMGKQYIVYWPSIKGKQ